MTTKEQIHARLLDGECLDYNRLSVEEREAVDELLEETRQRFED